MISLSVVEQSKSLQCCLVLKIAENCKCDNLVMHHVQIRNVAGTALSIFSLIAKF